MKIGDLVWRLNEIKSVYGDLDVTTEEWFDAVPAVETIILSLDGEQTKRVVAINPDWKDTDSQVLGLECA